jgi:Tub family
MTTSVWVLVLLCLQALRIAPVVLQLGKVTDECFSLDFSAPLSPFQAFVLAMSAFDG